MPKKLKVFFVFVCETKSPKWVAPPLGLLYLAAYIREQFSLDIQVLHQGLEGISTSDVARRMVDFDADVAAISCMTPWAHVLPQLTQALRSSKPEMLIVLGGPHISAVGEKALEATCADVAVHGEGEIIFREVLQRYFEGGGFEGIPGVIYRNSENDIIVNPGEALKIEELDSLPFPAYDVVDVKKYWNRLSMVHVPNRHYISLFSSRGCPYGCIFCNKIFGRNFRAHSPERIVEEVKYYKRQYGIKEIEFLDDCFNLDGLRVKKYSDLLLRNIGPVKTSFGNGLRADLLQEDTVEALTQAGMYFVVLPLESGSPRIQELMRKRLDIEKFLKAVDYCVSRRIFTHSFTMFGSPTETLEEMKETVRIVEYSQLHTCAFFAAVPFPNTDLYTYALEKIPEKMANIDYNLVDFERVRFNLSAVSTEVFSQFFRSIRLQFYGHPSRLYRILRDYPQRKWLPVKGVKFLYNFAKGTF